MMRPVSLTMAAFGPFAGIEEISFEALGENPLFLINGPTGSGKTTILDAICFALYGKTTGDEREAAQMRCDIAAPGQLTYVELVFELQGQRWRIRREPEQLRPRDRGEGDTTHKPRAELVRLADDGQESVQALKLTEVKSAVEELLGLNVEQFRQVMVLPQGEFRKLLVAKSSEREKVFSHLFQTQVYNRIEASLKAQASAVRGKVEANRNQRLGILESVGFNRESELMTALKELRERHRVALERRDQADADRLAAEQASLVADQLAAEFARLDAARKALVDARTREPEIEKLHERLRSAQRARLIRPAFDRNRRAEVALETAVAKHVAAEQALRQADEARVQSQARVDRLASESPAMEKLEQQLREYRQYRERLAQLEAVNAQLQERRQELERHQRVVDAAGTVMASGGKEIEDLQTEIREAEHKHGLLEQRRLEVQRVSGLLEVARGLAQLRQEQADLLSARQGNTTERDRADTHLAQAQANLDRIELAWHSGQAARLASKLQAGAPCPVCGSIAHPAPARSEIDLPEPSEREQALKAVERARARKVSAGNEMIRLEARLSHQQTLIEAHVQQLSAEEDATVDGLEAMLDAARAGLRESEGEQSRLEKLLRRLQMQTERMESEATRRQAAELQLQQARTGLELARGELRQLEREIPEPWRDREQLTAEIGTQAQVLADWQSNREAARQALEQADLKLERARSDLDNAANGRDSCAEEADAARRDWLSALADSSFHTVAEFEQHLIEEPEMADIQARIDRYRQEFEQAQGAVASLEKTLAEREPPAIDRIRQQANQARADWEMHVQAYEQVDRQLNSLLNAQQKLEQLQARSGELEDRYALVGTLADTAAGKTGARVNLQRFVLSVMLDDVLLVASERLKRMSRGRYTLYRQRGKGKGVAASGLDLVVEDAYYGTQRPVVTLSGGESFMAALALALALSDVVQARSGGIQLDTLFIDEGFGSLDSEALEMAVRTLVELQSSGRMVGVISHVPELREWIRVRLDVLGSRTGSKTRAVLA